MRAAANDSEQELADLNLTLDRLKKYAPRAEFTQILREFASGKDTATIAATGKYEGAAVERIKDMLDSVAVARKNPAIAADLKARLTSEQYTMFIQSGT